MKDYIRSDMEYCASDRTSNHTGRNVAVVSNAVYGRPKRRPEVIGWYNSGGKRAIDIVVCILMLPVSIPVIAVCALALWFEGGQPFFRQDRLGLGGRRFKILKLRTMTCDAEARLAEYLANDPAMNLEWMQTQKLKSDPRITRLGRFMRATSLDELPQLWNVLKGDMSMIGPRPMLPEQLPLYGDPHAYFALRPGISGFWQVSARNESHFAFRHETDADYLSRVSVWTDFGVLWKTVGVVLRPTGY